MTTKPKIYSRMGKWFVEISNGMSLAFCGDTPRTAWRNYEENWLRFQTTS